jgi:transposase
MGKKWTEEEKSVLARYYPGADSVDEVAEMLGRPPLAVIKKALQMGLKRPDPHDESMQRLKKVISDVPRSPSEIAALLGFSRNSMADVLRRGHKEGLCHIAEYRTAEGRGRDSPLWVAGAGENAQNDFAVERKEREALRAAHAAKPFKAFRDPFIEAFYGAAA